MFVRQRRDQLSFGLVFRWRIKMSGFAFCIAKLHAILLIDFCWGFGITVLVRFESHQLCDFPILGFHPAHELRQGYPLNLSI